MDQAWNQYLNRQMLSSISAGPGECLSSAAAGGGRVESKGRLHLSIWYNPFLPSSMTLMAILSLESLTKCGIFKKDGLMYSRMALNLLCSQGRSWTNYPLVSPSLLLVGVYACATMPFMRRCGSHPELCTHWRSILPIEVQLQPQKFHFSKNPRIISLTLPHFVQLSPCM